MGLVGAYLRACVRGRLIGWLVEGFEGWLRDSGELDKRDQLYGWTAGWTEVRHAPVCQSSLFVCSFRACVGMC